MSGILLALDLLLAKRSLFSNSPCSGMATGCFRCSLDPENMDVSSNLTDKQNTPWFPRIRWFSITLARSLPILAYKDFTHHITQESGLLWITLLIFIQNHIHHSLIDVVMSFIDLRLYLCLHHWRCVVVSYELIITSLNLFSADMTSVTLLFICPLTLKTTT